MLELKESQSKNTKIFSPKKLTLHEIRISILSLARLMNTIGLHGDKIPQKDDENARYPIFGKTSFRTIKSGYYDVDHMTLASKCTYFVTLDERLCKKAKEIYSFLGIKTTPVLLKDFVNMDLTDNRVIPPDPH